MDKNDFKRLFNEAATEAGFEKAHGGWFKASPECVVVLDLQRSNFGNYYELNFKIFVQGVGGRQYGRTKAMVRNLTGDVFLRQPNRFRPVLDLDALMLEEERRFALKTLFQEFVTPVTMEALSRRGLVSLAARGSVHLMPSMRRELGLDS